jgi:hypothetical protein
MSPKTRLRAGHLDMIYENGFLRQIQIGDTEVLRMIYFAVRDHNWGTLAPIIEQEIIEQGEDHFRISYHCRHQEHAQDCYAWDVAMEGLSNGTITFQIQGTALAAFRSNRVGFCVLHPIHGLAGETVAITQSNGEMVKAVFPPFIAPAQPILDIRAMSWQMNEPREKQSMELNLAFEGDIFETEDHRNWGDASYKTYCTPLEKPFPVVQNPGDKVVQKITFTTEILATAEDSLKTLPSFAEKASGDKPLLAIGIGASYLKKAITASNAVLLKSLNLRHYRIEVQPVLTDWILDFSNEAGNAYELQLPLEIALHLGAEFQVEIESFVQLCQQNRLNIKFLLLFSTQSLVTPVNIIQQIPFLKQALPDVKIGVGTNYNFTELNRNRFNPELADFITFSFHPQEHAFDEMTIMENAETLLYAVESARAIYQLPIQVSPITLRKRFNPYATDPQDWIIDEDQRADPRQVASFTAAWVKKCMAHLEKAGAQSATFFQTFGSQGVLDEDGQLFPVYNALIK